MTCVMAARIASISRCWALLALNLWVNLLKLTLVQALKSVAKVLTVDADMTPPSPVSSPSSIWSPSSHRSTYLFNRHVGRCC